MSIDKTDEEKRADLIYELVKERYDDQVSRLRKLDDQARTLISSILMGVGFLLAAGTTSFINVRTPTFILYFIVLGLLFA
jgi:hypothetical protein